MTPPDDIQSELTKIASPELRGAAIALSELITSVVTQTLPPEEVQARIATHPELRGLIAVLAGKHFVSRDSQVDFGDGAQLGDVTIRDVVKGDSYTFNLPPQPQPLGKRGRPRSSPGARSKAEKTYTIFVSHAEENKVLANALFEALSDAFAGQISFFLANRSLQAGQRWKEELRLRLQKSNAVISLLTPAALQKPWIYFELSPFWLAAKRCYLLLTDGVDVDDLIEPMRDSHAVRVKDLIDAEQARAFLEVIARDAGAVGAVPRAVVTQLALALPAALDTDRRQTYLPYAEDGIELPDDTQAARKVLEHFLAMGDLPRFRQVAAKLQSDKLRADIASRLIRDGSLALADELVSPIKTIEELRRIIHAYVEHSHVESRQIRHAIDTMRLRANDTELRRLANYFVEHRQEQTETFRYVYEQIINMAELRQVAVYLITQQRWSSEPFRAITRRVGENNRAELRKIAVEFIKHELHHTAEFDSIMIVLIEKNPAQAISVLEEITRVEPDFVHSFSKRFAAQLSSADQVQEWLGPRITGRSEPGR